MHVRLWAAASVGFLFVLIAVTLGLLWITLPMVLGTIPGATPGIGTWVLRGALAVLCLFTAIYAVLLIRIACTTFPFQDGVAIARWEAPLLWREVERVAAALGAPRPHRLVLSDRVGASICSRRSWLMFSWRHSLEIGLPLLRALPPEEIRAVLAHELAHLRRGDTRLSRLVYRAHALWGTLDPLVSRKPAGALDRWFRRNIRRSQVVGRRHRIASERAADAACLRVVSGSVAARALVRSMLADRQVDRWLRADLLRQRVHDTTPPEDRVERMHQALATQDPDSTAWLTEQTCEITCPGNSHPCLRDRLMVLTGRGEIDLPCPITERECAASALLGSLRHKVARRLSMRWRERHGAAWCQATATFRGWRTRAGELLETADSLDASALREVVVMLQALDESAKARAPLERLIRLDPSDAESRLRLADVLLEHGTVDEEITARGLLHHVCESQPSLRAGCEAALGRWHARHGRVELAREAFKRAIALWRESTR